MLTAARNVLTVLCQWLRKTSCCYADFLSDSAQIGLAGHKEVDTEARGLFQKGLVTLHVRCRNCRHMECVLCA